MEKRNGNVIILIGSLLIILASVYEFIVDKKTITYTQIISFICAVAILLSMLYSNSNKN
jgi:hypothetical protein